MSNQFGRSTVRAEQQKPPMQRQQPVGNSHRRRESKSRILRIASQSPTDTTHNTNESRRLSMHYTIQTQFITCLFRSKVLPRPWSQALSDLLLTLQQGLMDADDHGVRLAFWVFGFVQPEVGFKRDSARSASMMVKSNSTAARCEIEFFLDCTLPKIIWNLLYVFPVLCSQYVS